MFERKTITACVAVIWATLLYPAFADTISTWETCEGKHNADAATRVEACQATMKEPIPQNVRADAYNNLGVAYADLKQWRDAIHAYSEALRIFKPYASEPEVQSLIDYIRANRAQMYLQDEQYENALDDFKRLDQAKNVGPFLAEKCWIEAVLNDDNGPRDCETAEHGGNGPFLAFLGHLVQTYRAKRYDQTIADCDLVSRSDQHLPATHYICALARQHLNDPKSREDLETAKREDAGIVDKVARWGIKP